jgi:hypothetical protein
MALSDGIATLGGDVNKHTDSRKLDVDEGIISEKIPELALDIDDEELIQLAKKYKKDWETFMASRKKKQELVEKYWEGNQGSIWIDDTSTDTVRPNIDNLIFESLETYLPLVTRANPEASVSKGTDIENAMAAELLNGWADDTRLKLLIKDCTRHWALYFLGVGEVYWDTQTGEPCLNVVRPQKIILDPKATIRAGKYTGKIVGLYESETAKELAERFPAQANWITEKVQGKMGTEIQYIKWYTPDMVFWTLNHRILDKIKNPNFNYTEQKTTIDEYGAEIPTEIQGKNHLSKPEIPVSFISVINTGKHPIDDTSNIWQVIPQQDTINKRNRQIDKNNDNINGGWAISGAKTGLTREEATEAVVAWQEGDAVFVPDGNINEGVTKMMGQPLPNSVYTQQQDARAELRNIFGTSGSTAQGIKSQETARGKILAKGSDDSRIGGGVSEYLEQFADGIYNQVLQMYYVYAPERVESITSKLRISVKEGSMIPKDSLTRRNEAIDLFTAGALAPIDLYKRLEDPNPEQTVQNLMMWQQGMAAATQQPIPSESNQNLSADNTGQDLLKSVPTN